TRIYQICYFTFQPILGSAHFTLSFRQVDFFKNELRPLIIMTSSSSSVLNDFPTEILLRIFEHIEPRTRSQHLEDYWPSYLDLDEPLDHSHLSTALSRILTLSAVCKFWRAIVSSCGFWNVFDWTKTIQWHQPVSQLRDFHRHIADELPRIANVREVMINLKLLRFPDYIETLGRILRTGNVEVIWVKFRNNPDFHYINDSNSSKGIDALISKEFRSMHRYLRKLRVLKVRDCPLDPKNWNRLFKIIPDSAIRRITELDIACKMSDSTLNYTLREFSKRMRRSDAKILCLSEATQNVHTFWASPLSSLTSFLGCFGRLVSLEIDYTTIARAYKDEATDKVKKACIVEFPHLSREHQYCMNILLSTVLRNTILESLKVLCLDWFDGEALVVFKEKTGLKSLEVGFYDQMVFSRLRDDNPNLTTRTEQLDWITAQNEALLAKDIHVQWQGIRELCTRLTPFFHHAAIHLHDEDDFDDFAPIVLPDFFIEPVVLPDPLGLLEDEELQEFW
ncbi:hypothetical protein NEOLI_001462, partial [Neolecta irregularis DAH-3]